MNGRQRELVRLLLRSGQEFQSMDHLASKLGCSEKTVRNDLNLVKAVLKSYPDASLIRKQGIGVYLQISEKEKEQLFQSLFETKEKTDEDRIIRIAHQLLTREKPVTLKQLAETHYTNSATIKKDLDKMEDWLAQFHLSLHSKQRVGSSVSGSELHKRNALAHLSELVSSAAEKNYVLDLFPAYEITSVRKLLKDLQSHHGIDFTAGGLESMLIHALIMIRRTRQASPIILSSEQKQEVVGTSAYRMTEQLLTKMEEQFQLTFPENEKVYYSWHLISSIKQTGQDTMLLASGSNVDDVVKQLTKKLQQLTVIPFEHDQALADGLLVHLHAVVHRISYGFAIRNPLLSDIKKMYPYMFSMMVLALEDITSRFHLDIPEDEAAYLVLHFQASIERLEKQREMKKRVLIVCHMGVGMSRLLQAKIEQQYAGIDILDCIGQMELQAYLSQHEVDFIISTVSVDHVSIPSIVVSPLLEANDKARLNQFFQTLESKPKGTTKGAPFVPLMDERCIFLDVRLEHRFEVVEMMANVLVEKGLVTKKFVHHALLRERSAATVIGGGIAIPHARPETVKQSVVSVAIMDEPLQWGDEKVSVVFLLAVTKEEQKKTRGIMQSISTISGDPELVQKLKQANNASEVQSILSKSETQHG